ncbi:probable E3 ubiquitin-protein ligase RZFP34 [Syzygium oleosum]|uniref:probable E3 ubiquitin-protein ligase RZFP34 n=1 Tax=Syzygium oleosum TaxID=219896 RepID=UPI0024BA0BCE|nr:probable E3 ubiquitin-protein ligase RZFP34 [Syzygium oleosum]XP_056174737.1 probable E3 ubiquitin-protein ligase RZFP34 [Syzygium oleosum]
MGEVAIEQRGFQQFDAENLQRVFYEESQTDTEFTVLRQMNGEPMPVEKTKDDASATELLERGCLQYGCPHYHQRCRIRAPCCNEIFDCRHCHNDAKNNIDVNQKERHELPRHQVQQVVCSLCGTEQEVRQVCINCGVCMGKYFCGTCKLFNDDVSQSFFIWLVNFFCASRTVTLVESLSMSDEVSFCPLPLAISIKILFLLNFFHLLHQVTLQISHTNCFEPGGRRWFDGLRSSRRPCRSWGRGGHAT